MNFQTDIKSAGNDGLTALELDAALLGVYDSRENLAQWTLLLEQESYLPYIKKVIKKILQTIDSYIAILKNQTAKTLDTIIGENLSPAIKKNPIILHTLFTTCDTYSMCQIN